MWLRPLVRRRDALAEVVHERGESHRGVGRQLARDVEHLQRVDAGVDLRDATCAGCGTPNSAVDLRETAPRARRTRAAPRNRPCGGCLAERALGFDPDALGHQRLQSRRSARCRCISSHRLRRDREAERREARREARDAQHAQRVFDEGGRDVAQHARLEVAAAAVGIDERRRRASLRHRVDRQVAPREVFLERDVGREARREAVVAGARSCARCGRARTGRRSADAGTPGKSLPTGR